MSVLSVYASLSVCLFVSFSIIDILKYTYIHRYIHKHIHRYRYSYIYRYVCKFIRTHVRVLAYTRVHRHIFMRFLSSLSSSSSFSCLFLSISPPIPHLSSSPSLPFFLLSLLYTLASSFSLSLFFFYLSLLPLSSRFHPYPHFFLILLFSPIFSSHTSSLLPLPSSFTLDSPSFILYSSNYFVRFLFTSSSPPSHIVNLPLPFSLFPPLLPFSLTSHSFPFNSPPFSLSF